MKIILDENAINQSLKRIAFEILERNKTLDNVIIVGIKTRGEFLAKRIAEFLYSIENIKVECISIDVSPFRDDHKKQEKQKQDIQIDGKIVVLVDDVLFKGRTARAALDALTYHGRAKAVQFAVLIDRGHRELPIRADYVGKNIPTSLEENVKVCITPIDENNEVHIENNPSL